LRLQSNKLGIGAKNSIAVVEYFGKFPGLVPHGNSKVNREYIRTPATVMSEKSDLLERENPLNVCNKLTLFKCENMSIKVLNIEI
jgi:hypothetical protein